MRELLLQDWITIRSQSDTMLVTQGADQWLDIGDFEDFTVFLEVRELLSTATTMMYQTAPAKNEAAFLSMTPAFHVSTGLRVDRIVTAYAAVPPARWFRWKLIHGTTPWDLTFRIHLAGYAWVKT
jgi:hypothetical protein